MQDKLLGIDRKGGAQAAQEAGQSAVERAKAVEDALANSLKTQTEQIKLAADEQRRIADEAASQRLSAEGPGAVEAIDRQRREARKAIAIQEAQDLEKIALESLSKQAAAREAVLKAEIAGAGKNTSAKVAAEEELTNLADVTAKQRVKIQADAAQAMQGISNKTFQEQAKAARELNKIIEETAQDQIQSRIDLMDDQINLIEAQVDAEVLTTQQGRDQIQAIHRARFAEIEGRYRRQAEVAAKAIEAELGQTETANAKIVQVYQDRDQKIAALQVQQQTQTRRALTEQEQEYKRLADGITGTMSDVFQDMLEGTLDLGQVDQKLVHSAHRGPRGLCGHACDHPAHHHRVCWGACSVKGARGVVSWEPSCRRWAWARECWALLGVGVGAALAAGVGLASWKASDCSAA